MTYADNLDPIDRNFNYRLEFDPKSSYGTNNYSKITEGFRLQFKNV